MSCLPFRSFKTCFFSAMRTILSITMNFKSYMRKLCQKVPISHTRNMTGFHSKRWMMLNFQPDIIKNYLHGIKFYPKNTSESVHVDSNQKKMKYRAIFQFLNSFNFLLSLTSKFHRDKSTNPNVLTNDFDTKLSVKSS